MEFRPSSRTPRFPAVRVVAERRGLEEGENDAHSRDPPPRDDSSQQRPPYRYQPVQSTRSPNGRTSRDTHYIPNGERHQGRRLSDDTFDWHRKGRRSVANQGPKAAQAWGNPQASTPWPTTSSDIDSTVMTGVERHPEFRKDHVPHTVRARRQEHPSSSRPSKECYEQKTAALKNFCNVPCLVNSEASSSSFSWEEDSLNHKATAEDLFYGRTNNPSSNRSKDASIAKYKETRRDDFSSHQMIEISPGHFERLRGADETWQAMWRGFFMPCECMSCSLVIFCIQDARYALCPDCRVLSPMGGEDSKEPASGGGVGLGVKWEDLAKCHDTTNTF